MGTKEVRKEKESGTIEVLDVLVVAGPTHKGLFIGRMPTTILS